MRNIVTAIALGIAVLLMAIALALAIVDSQPRYTAQLHNAYWPYSVEISIKDR